MLQDPWDFADFSLTFQTSETQSEYNIRKTSLADKFDLWRFSSLSLRICFEETNAPESLVSTLVIKTMTFFFFFFSSRSPYLSKEPKPQDKEINGFFPKGQVLIQLQNNGDAIQLHYNFIFNPWIKLNSHSFSLIPCGSRGERGLFRN